MIPLFTVGGLLVFILYSYSAAYLETTELQEISLLPDCHQGRSLSCKPILRSQTLTSESTVRVAITRASVPVFSVGWIAGAKKGL